MNNLNAAATEIFQILRSYDYAVQMWDDDGEAVFEPEEARRLFCTPENLTVSITDENDNSSVHLYLSKSTDVQAVIGLIQALRTCATKYNMVFANRKYEKELEPKDFHSKASVREGRIMNQLTEGMYGTSRSSYLKLENARMIVRHSDRINENIVGARGRHIESIFCENDLGERFMFPTTQLAPARAMTQHVNQGGSFADDVGQHILRMAEDYRNLGACAQFVRHNAGSLTESAMNVREACRTKCVEMRKCFERLYREGTYGDQCTKLDEYVADGTLVETALVEHLRRTLAVEGKEIPESMVNTVAKYLTTESFIDEAREQAVPMTSVLGKPVSSAAWADLLAGKLDLVAQPNRDEKQPGFTSKQAELAYKLSKIVPNVRDDSMMNFLSYVSEELQAAAPDMQKKFAMIAKAAIKAAGMVMDEGIATKNEAILEFANWFKTSEPYRMLSENWDDPRFDNGDEDAAENLMDNFSADDFIATNAEYGGDGVGHTLYKSDVMSNLKAYLEREMRVTQDIENYDTSDLAVDAWDEVEKALRNKGYEIEDDGPADESEEFDGDAVEPASDDEFALGEAAESDEDSSSEDDADSDDEEVVEEDADTDEDSEVVEEDIELRREDVLLPKNPGKSLSNEVTPRTITSPTTGKEIDADADAINQMQALAGIRKTSI